MTSPLLGIDVSHYQGTPNYAAFRAAGGSYVIAKGTDGTGFIDPQLAYNRANAKANGLVFGTYHFAEWGNPAAEAAFYLLHANPQPGELVALDAEAAIPAGVDVVAWCDQWSRAVKAAVGAAPLIYMNQSWLAGHNWAPVLADNDSLWLAKYDGSPAQPAGSGVWPAVSFKQWSSTGSEPGVSGAVDLDEFYGTPSALAKFTVPATGPTPAPTPGGTVTASDLTPVAVQEVSDAVANRTYEGVPGQPGAKPAWLVAVETHETVLALKAELDGLLAKVAAPAPVTVDQAAADQIAASLVANPQFQQLVANAASKVVLAEDADLAKRFGPQ